MAKIVSLGNLDKDSVSAAIDPDDHTFSGFLADINPHVNCLLTAKPTVLLQLARRSLKSFSEISWANKKKRKKYNTDNITFVEAS